MGYFNRAVLRDIRTVHNDKRAEETDDEMQELDRALADYSIAYRLSPSQMVLWNRALLLLR